MKGFVLAGGFPQIDLIQKLKKRGIETVLADYYEHPVARDYADKFLRISTLDVEAVRKAAIDEKVDFLITVCTDQALLTVAQVSEELQLPCYIDYQTARNVTNKEYMKRVFFNNNVPTAKYTVMKVLDLEQLHGWSFPLIVKPVDCNSSKGVKKVTNESELLEAFQAAVQYSRTNTAIVEEYVEGPELSVDVYVQNGVAHILDVTTSEKIDDDDKFVIIRTWHKKTLYEKHLCEVQAIAQKIATAFSIENAPMLIQLIASNNGMRVIEFSARTGGGVKHLSIERQTRVDIVSYVIDLTLGKPPELHPEHLHQNYMLDEYIYCRPGIFSELYGFAELKESGDILDYYQFRWKGSKFDSVANSGDRIAGFTIVADTIETLKEKHKRVNEKAKVLSVEGADLMRHDLSEIKL